jgi:subtilisin family serine protease
LLADYFTKRLLTITVILTFLLSSTALTNTIVGTSYASQVQAQAPLPPSSSSAQTPPPFTPICNPKSPSLQLGSTGAKVTELQRALTQVGYGPLLGQGVIDGNFATSTQNAVKKFQQDNRLPVDGKVGPVTWGALCAFIPNSFIVQLKSAGPGPLSPGSLREVMGQLTPQLAAVGGRIVAVYDQFGMFNVVFERPLPNRDQVINSLRAHPAVQGVFSDAIVTAQQAQVNSTGIDRVDADLSAAKSGDKTGSVDVDIAVLDTGVSSHPDLNLFRCVSFVTFVPLPICNDGHGHGTHVAGTAAARDNNIGVVGTAPGARIWALKVLGDNGRGDDSDALEGLNYVAANAKDIDVINLSFGHLGFSFPYLLASNILVGRGVVVVISAGNDNLDASNFTPASTPTSITVSAVTDSDGKCGGAGPAISRGGAHIFQPSTINNPDDFIASYSNFGSVVDLAAPGTRILSTGNTGGYISMSGTSMAAPHVAGAAALYKSLHPTANPFQVDAFLKNAGTKVPATGNPLIPCNGAGLGYFNDRYSGVLVFTDKDKEPLLHMGGIR